MTLQEFYDRFFPDMPLYEWQTMMIQAWLDNDPTVTFSRPMRRCGFTVTITVTHPPTTDDTVLEDETALLDTELE